MLKPIINQKWARPPTQGWKRAVQKHEKALQALFSLLSRLDNHTGSMNVITLEIPICLDASFRSWFFCVSIRERPLAIPVYTNYTSRECTAWPFLDLIRFWPSDGARWGENFFIIRWWTTEGRLKQPVAISLANLKVAFAGYWAVEAMQRWRLDGQKQMKGRGRTIRARRRNRKGVSLWLAECCIYCDELPGLWFFKKRYS